jgi:aspartate-semialdehyde dehydrogenase
LSEIIALIGGETLLGHEVREVFGESALGGRLRLVAAEEEEAGKLTEVGGAAAFISKLAPDSVEDAAVIILAGTAASSKDALASEYSGIVVDLTAYTEDEPNSQLRSPLAEAADFRPDLSGPQVVAHPAATAIAILLNTLHRAIPVARAIVHVFEPASERGKTGIEELQQQAVSLFSFQPMPKKVFDAQVAFNMRPQWGEDAPEKLQDVEERIERHLASLLERTGLENAAPMPSLRLIQAPVFHGYALSLWVDLEESAGLAEVEEALSVELIDLRGPDVEPPDNVGIAGHSGIAVGSVSSDRNSGSAFWIWAAVDNLRLAAESAAMIAREAV